MKVSEEIRAVARHFCDTFCTPQKCRKCNYDIHIVRRVRVCPSVLLSEIAKRAEQLENAHCCDCAKFEPEKNFCRSKQTIVSPEANIGKCFKLKREQKGDEA